MINIPLLRMVCYNSLNKLTLFGGGNKTIGCFPEKLKNFRFSLRLNSMLGQQKKQQLADR